MAVVGADPKVSGSVAERKGGSMAPTRSISKPSLIHEAADAIRAEETAFAQGDKGDAATSGATSTSVEQQDAAASARRPPGPVILWDDLNRREPSKS
jgi:hypothetical protein